MEPFSGRYSVAADDRTDPIAQGPCKVTIEVEAGITITGASGKTGLLVPFRELVRFEKRDYALSLTLHSGGWVVLEALGKRLDEACERVRDARREHFLTSLMLKERGAAASQPGFARWRLAGAESAHEEPCSVRLQRTSLVLFPDCARPFVVPYGELAASRFDEQAYAQVLELADGGRLELGRFARRTGQFRHDLEQRVGALSKRHLTALTALLPELDPLAIQRLAIVLRDGVPAARDAIIGASPTAWGEIWRRSFASAARRKTAEHLAARAQLAFLAMKERELRAANPGEAGEGSEAEEGTEADAETGMDAEAETTADAMTDAEAQAETDADAEADAGDEAGAEATPETLLPPELEGRELVYLFQIGSALAVEVPTSTGSATYVFRAGGDPARRARELLRAFAAVQFRREPIYLPDEALLTGRHARYREAVALVPELATMRAAFLGRAIHAGADRWQRELEQALGRA